MPIGIQRINAKKSQPNPCIVFIKPLKGPDEKIAENFLERIAAQCLPVMREHGLSVMSLEEYEPNREFVGRNFNAGEVVQLVLKSLGSRRWLPFEYVQMVMMHELAHCKQMNHSRAFWAVRNQYAAQMHGLWAEGYMGDGIWGRGAKLSTGDWERNTVRADEILPEHLCGGTYRSRRRKRKTKSTLSYQERKERRILKKFGKNGVALGADDEAKVKLEKGKKVQSKPRVAGSARGRELRAAAALARFERQKEPEVDLKDEDETESGTESEYEDGDLDSKDALDVDGSRLTDGNGRGLVKVCEDEDTDDPGARNESDELKDMFRVRIKRESPGLVPLEAPQRRDREKATRQSGRAPVSGQPSAQAVKPEPFDEDSDSQDLNNVPMAPTAGSNPAVKPEPFEEDSDSDSQDLNSVSVTPIARSNQRPPDQPAPVEKNGSTQPAQTSLRLKPIEEGKRSEEETCSVCSFANTRSAVTCAMCANVLNPAENPNAWRCDNEPCRDSAYLNSGDCGVCGLCGRRRASS